MKIGIMSDSHGDKLKIEQAVEKAGTVDLWVHAGDFCNDANHLAVVSGTEVVGVAGNCDGLAAKYPLDKFIDIDGRKVWITHGHRYQVKYGTDQLINLARQFDVAVVIYGHTHIVDVRRFRNLLVINPGSVGRPYGQKPSFVLMDTAGGDVSTELVEIL